MKSVARTPLEISPHVGVFRCFSNSSPQIAVERHSIKAAPEVELWAILVGEQGRGRWRSALLVDRPEGDGDVRHVRVAAQAPTSDDWCILHLPLSIGFRGGNGYSGDIVSSPDNGEILERLSDPSIVLCEGEIAQGDAGGMGSGTQRVCLLPRGKVLRTYRTGRLYGAPASRYWLFDGERVHCRTWSERVSLADVEGDVYPLPAERAEVAS